MKAVGSRQLGRPMPIAERRREASETQRVPNGMMVLRPRSTRTTTSNANHKTYDVCLDVESILHSRPRRQK